MAFRVSRLALLAGTIASVSCVSAEFSTLRVDQEPNAEQLAAVKIGDSLQACLDALGAPTAVTRDDEGVRTVLTWQWLEARGWGLSASVPLTDRNSASVDYASNSQNPQQLRVFFDSSWNVVEVSRERDG